VISIIVPSSNTPLLLTERGPHSTFRRCQKSARHRCPVPVKSRCSPTANRNSIAIKGIVLEAARVARRPAIEIVGVSVVVCPLTKMFRVSPGVAGADGIAATRWIVACSEAVTLENNRCTSDRVTVRLSRLPCSPRRRATRRCFEANTLNCVSREYVISISRRRSSRTFVLFSRSGAGQVPFDRT